MTQLRKHFSVSSVVLNDSRVIGENGQNSNSPILLELS